LKKSLFWLLSSIVFTLSFSAHAVSPDVIALQKQWERVNYRLKDKAQLSAYEALKLDADKAKEKSPKDAEVLIWHGIIYSSYAGAKGGVGALSLARTAKKDLEEAISIDSHALNGSAYTTLGTLYYKVPGWPLGFRNRAMAEELLKQALLIDPEGIDSNYFYARYLQDEKQYESAEKYLLKARQAPERPDRLMADIGRHKDINEALKEIKQITQPDDSAAITH